jgi:membrane-bound lytic murein transglycosylase A
VQSLPRAQIDAYTSRVIAYGRPIDVFFLQVQGSGRLRYGDGRSLRAAYAANNGKRYRSIGRVLIDRGELTRDQSAKRNIEAWMAENGPTATRELMNQNPRYIFFVEQRIEPGEGPRGAMQVPLTGMGSVAVDPRYHPYGTLIWLDTKLPQAPRDYRGTEMGLLTVAQDTGSAIRGPLRGDLFFGSGPDAGALAGVMKHDVRWTVLVPKGLVQNSNSES